MEFHFPELTDAHKQILEIGIWVAGIVWMVAAGFGTYIALSPKHKPPLERPERPKPPLKDTDPGW